MCAGADALLYTCLGGRYRLGQGSVDLDAEDRVQAGLMYSQAAVTPVKVAETGRAALLVIRGSEK